MTTPLKAAILRDRSIVAVSGPDRVKFLQGLITNDIRRLRPDRALYAGFLTGQGKLLYDLFLSTMDGDRVLIDIAAAHVDDFFARLTRFKLNASVEFAEARPSLAVAAIWGPEAVARLGLEAEEDVAGVAATLGGHLAFVDPRIVDLGVRLIFPADDPKAELARLGFGSATTSDYAAHRLALGVADTGEIAGEICYPLEANFETLHGVDFRKGCYVGQELTARMKLKGELRKRILRVTGTEALPAAGVPVTAGSSELGQLIAASGTQGLALLRLDRLASADEGAIHAQGVPVGVHWPSWLPR